MSGAKIFSLEGKGLKLTTAEDIEPHIQDLKSNDDVEEIKFLGNTLGIGASEALAKVLESKKKLQVWLQARFVFSGRSMKGLT
jgi:Ran GTPase-activating protein 1